MKGLKRVGLAVLILGFLTILLGISLLLVEGKRKPQTNAQYVALGSSFAAGLSLGARTPGSPFACQRSVNGYPQQLARITGLALGDMTCSGATIHHVLHGGQYFQGPQIDALGPQAELVTLTAGGNDIDYVGDLMTMSYRHRTGLVGFVANQFSHDAKPTENRQFAQLKNEMIATLKEVGKRAPKARILVVTYPVILPPSGTCAQIGITESEAALMRDVGTQLAKVTREAAQSVGASILDMATLSNDHDACSPSPWVNGATPKYGAPFHPTLAGAEATAKQIKQMLVEKNGE